MNISVGREEPAASGESGVPFEVQPGCSHLRVGEVLLQGEAQGLRRSCAVGIQRGADVVERLPKSGNARVPIGQLSVAVFCGGEPFLHLSHAALECIEVVCSVLVKEPLDAVPIGFGLRERGGVEVEAFSLHFGLSGRVVEFNAAAANAVEQFGGARVDGGHGLQRPFRIVKPVQSTGFILQNCVHPVQGFLDFPGMGQGVQPLVEVTQPLSSKSMCDNSSNW